MSVKVNFSLKVLVPLATFLIAVSLLFVTVLYDYAPKINVLPQIFTKEPMNFGQFVETTNMQANLSEKELIREMLLRFYVENRHTYIPDRGELIYRYGPNGPVAALSTPAIYRRFTGSLGNYLENLKGKTATTTVDIVAYDHRDRDTYQIDFDTYVYDQGRIAKAGRRRAMIKVAYKKNCVRYRTDFANPYCMVVTTYDETGLKK